MVCVLATERLVSSDRGVRTRPYPYPGSMTVTSNLRPLAGVVSVMFRHQGWRSFLAQPLSNGSHSFGMPGSRVRARLSTAPLKRDGIGGGLGRCRATTLTECEGAVSDDSIAVAGGISRIPQIEQGAL